MGNNKFSIASVGNRRAFRDGARDGVPIALGYFAVSFSLGIVARNVGMTPIQGMITSALCNASAGEYAGFTMIAAGAAYIEMAIVTLIANARYLLMSCAMSQRMDPDMPFFHRLLMAFDITDELFGIDRKTGLLKSLVYVRGNRISASRLGSRNGTRRTCGKSDAVASCERIQCCTLWNVPCDHHSAGEKEPDPCRTHRDQLCGELSCGESSGDLIDLQRYENDHPDCCALIRSSDSLPASGRGQ